MLDLNHDDGRRAAVHPDRAGPAGRGDSYARSLTADRLQRVVTGDWKNGKRRRRSAAAIASEARQEGRRRRAAQHGARGAGRHGHRLALRCRSAAARRARQRPADAGYKYLVAHNADNEGFFLIWNGTKGNTDFTEDDVRSLRQGGEEGWPAPRYHVYARLYLFQTSNVVFYQIPDRILMDFGLDLRGEPYHDDES